MRGRRDRSQARSFVAVEQLDHILNWFDKYLMSKDIALYDQQ